MNRARRQASIGRTAEKLYHAQLHLEAWAALQTDEERFNREAWAISYQESVLLHLELAWLSFLAELAEFYKLDRPRDLADLERMLKAADIVAPELITLSERWQERGDDLHDLQEAWSSLRVPPAENGKDTRPSAPAMIATAQESRGPGFDRLSQWWRALRAAIEAGRQQMQEW